jgi:hypothetical protein
MNAVEEKGFTYEDRRYVEDFIDEELLDTVKRRERACTRRGIEQILSDLWLISFGLRWTRMRKLSRMKTRMRMGKMRRHKTKTMCNENDGNRATKNKDGGGSENHCNDHWQQPQRKSGLDADIGRGYLD